MPKKPKTAKAKANKKAQAASHVEARQSSAANSEDQKKERPMLRAIRVTSAVLAAAKAYKKETGKSFYALGLEAISRVLKKEGYLKEESKA